MLSNRHIILILSILSILVIIVIYYIRNNKCYRVNCNDKDLIKNSFYKLKSAIDSPPGIQLHIEPVLSEYSGENNGNNMCTMKYKNYFRNPYSFKYQKDNNCNWTPLGVVKKDSFMTFEEISKLQEKDKMNLLFI